MTTKQQKEHFTLLTEKLQKILFKKGKDYSNNTNCLSNFREVSFITTKNKYTPYLTLIGVKLSRLSNLLLNNKKPKNEAIEDSIYDLINYSFLLYCEYMDKGEVKKNESFFKKDILKADEFDYQLGEFNSGMLKTNAETFAEEFQNLSFL